MKFLSETKNKKFFSTVYFYLPQLVGVVFLFLYFFMATNIACATGIAEPVISVMENNNGFYIDGIAPRNSEVMVYVDGVIHGIASKDCISSRNNTDDNFFCYKSSDNFFSKDRKIILVAKDKTSLVLSPPVMFEFLPAKKDKTTSSLVVEDSKKSLIKSKMPAPTLLSAVYSDGEIKILGLAKNDSLVKVFVNDKFNGKFLVKNHDSGTANFHYIVDGELQRGKYSIYATAEDGNGKFSIKSDQVSIGIRYPKIAKSVSAKNNNIVSKILPNGDNLTNVFEDSVASDTGSQDFEKVINNSGENKGIKKDQGLIDEKKEKQNKLNINLFIFIGFILVAIIWIIWINKEIAKDQGE